MSKLLHKELNGCILFIQWWIWKLHSAIESRSKLNPF